MFNPLDPYGYLDEEEKQPGSPGHILDFLSYFDRPRNAVAAGIKGLGQGDPLGGFWRGLTGEEDVSFGDLVGIERGRPDDDWATWLAKSGSRFALDAVLDPLNVLFMPAKATGMIGKGLMAAGIPEGSTAIGQAWKYLPDAVQYENIANKMAESGLARRFAHRLPQTEKYGWMEDLIDDVSLQSQNIPIRTAVKSGNEGMDELLKGTAYTPRDVYARAEGIGPQDLASEAARVHVDPLKRMNEQMFGTRNELLDDLGLPTHQMVDESYVQHVPHKQVPGHEIPEEGERIWVGGKPYWKMPTREKAKLLGDAPYTENAFNQPHAEIASWRRTQDPDIGQLGMAPDVQVAVGKLADKRTGVKRLEDGTYIHEPTGYEVFPTRASLEDVKGVMPKGSMLENPVDAFGKNLDWMDRQSTFLRTIKGLREKGAAQHYAGPDTLLEGYVPLNIPGFENMQVLPGIRNRLENLARVDWNKNLPGMWDEELLGAALNTKAGRALQDATGTWKRFALLDPGWMSANVVSNVQLQGLNGMRLRDMVQRNADAIKGIWGKDDVIEGIKNTDLLTELAKRKAVDVEGLWGGALREGAEKGTKTKAALDAITGKLGIGEGAGDVAQSGIKFVGDKLIDPFFKFGSKLEDQGKLAMAIDYIKKNAPDFANLNATDKTRVLDEAAKLAKKTLFDYSSLTPYERKLQQVVPFYNWMRNVTGATGKMANERPDILGRYGRGIDTVMEPMDREDKKIADSWVQQSGPAYGAMGTKFGKDAENRNLMALMGRFLPHGQIEALTKRPGETLLSSINPLLKAPVEVATNQNFFKGRPIDPLAGPISMFTAPLTGGMHDLGRSKILGKDVPASVEYLAGVLPGGRQLRQVDTLGRGFGLWDDPGKGPMEPGDAMIWSLSGGKTYPFDRDRALLNRQREDKAAEGQIKSRIRFANKRGDTSQLEYYMKLLEEDMAARAERRRKQWGPDAV
jgi:hypothetical protein